MSYVTSREAAASLRRSVAPEGFPVDLCAVKEHLRLGTIADEDRRLEDEIIPAAVEKVEHDTQRALMPQTWELRLDRFPCEIKLCRPPITAVSSIEYIDTAEATQTLSSSLYTVDLASAPGRIRPAYGTVWPCTLCVPNAVTVAFTAGYADAEAVPAIAKRAILLACSMEYYGPCMEAEKAYDVAVSRLQWGALL